jgi:hypothetical protein
VRRDFGSHSSREGPYLGEGRGASVGPQHPQHLEFRHEQDGKEHARSAPAFLSVGKSVQSVRYSLLKTGDAYPRIYIRRRRRDLGMHSAFVNILLFGQYAYNFMIIESETACDALIRTNVIRDVYIN